MEAEKTCTKCKEKKNVSMFYYRYGKPIAQCKKCTNKQKAEYKRKAREKARQEKIDSGKIKVSTNPNNFVCRGPCGLEKPSTEFRHNRKKCKECEKLYGRNYRKNEIGKEKAKKWVENNREQMTKLQADWYQENKQKINKKNVERYKTDIKYKLRHCCKTRLQQAFNNASSYKSKKTIKYLDCNIPYLIKWFEYCFTPNMNCENHGTYWHIDHVIPINTFDLDDPEQIKLCFGWFNVSPLKGNENLMKHDTINKVQLKKHISKLKNFIEKNSQDTQNNAPKEYFDLCARHLKTTGNP